MAAETYQNVTVGDLESPSQAACRAVLSKYAGEEIAPDPGYLVDAYGTWPAASIWNEAVAWAFEQAKDAVAKRILTAEEAVEVRSKAVNLLPGHILIEDVEVVCVKCGETVKAVEASMTSETGWVCNGCASGG